MALIKNAYTAMQIEHEGEKNNLPSMTIPNMTLSLQELLARHIRGEVLSAPSNRLEYTGEDEPIDVTKMDKMDMIDAAKEQANHVTNIELMIDEKNRIKAETMKKHEQDVKEKKTPPAEQ